MTVSEFVKADTEKNYPIVVEAPLDNDHYFYWNALDLVMGVGWDRIKNRRIKDIRQTWIIRTLVVYGGMFTSTDEDDYDF